MHFAAVQASLHLLPDGSSARRKKFRRARAPALITAAVFLFCLFSARKPDPFPRALSGIPWEVRLLAIGKSGTEADVRVGVRTVVVAVMVEDARVRGIVPVATDVRDYIRFPLVLLYSFWMLLSFGCSSFLPFLPGGWTSFFPFLPCG